MNISRAKKIAKLNDKLQGLNELLEDILSSEQDYNSNLSEKMLESEKGEISTNAIGSLENAILSIEGAIDALGEIEIE